MSLATCPDCNQAVSNDAFDCPGCGRPFRLRDVVLRRLVEERLLDEAPRAHADGGEA